MARAVLPDPFAAGLASGLRGYRLKDRPDERPRGGRASRHQSGTFQRALFPAAYAHADIQQAIAFDAGASPDRIGVAAVAAVYDNVAGFEQRQQRFQQRVDRGARLHHQHDLARQGER